MRPRLVLYLVLGALVGFVFLTLAVPWRIDGPWVVFGRDAYTQGAREVRRAEYVRNTKGLSFWRHIYIEKVKYDCFTVPDSDSLKCYMSPEDQGI